MDHEGSRCSICERDIVKKRRLLYGHDICRKCDASFASRRQFAFMIDMLLGRLLAEGIASLSLLGLGEAGVGLAAGGFSLIWILIKDASGGYSPGKKLMGVRVLNIESGMGAGVGDSMRRNAPLLIPFVPLFVAFQLHKGQRLGDGWAGTRVIWVKHRERAPFATTVTHRLGKPDTVGRTLP